MMALGRSFGFFANSRNSRPKPSERWFGNIRIRRSRRENRRNADNRFRPPNGPKPDIPTLRSPRYHYRIITGHIIRCAANFMLRCDRHGEVLDSYFRKSEQE
jgi:hypothetical protein